MLLGSWEVLTNILTSETFCSYSSVFILEYNCPIYNFSTAIYFLYLQRSVEMQMNIVIKYYRSYKFLSVKLFVVAQTQRLYLLFNNNFPPLALWWWHIVLYKYNAVCNMHAHHFQRKLHMLVGFYYDNHNY